MDTICALAVAMGADFAIFVPSVRKPMLRHHVQVRPLFYKPIVDLYSVASIFLAMFELYGKYYGCVSSQVMNG